MTITRIQIQEQRIKWHEVMMGKARIRQSIRALETALLTRSEAERNELIEFAQSLLKGAAQ